MTTAGNVITSPGANSLNTIENEILRDQLKQARVSCVVVVVVVVVVYLSDQLLIGV